MILEHLDVATGRSFSLKYPRGFVGGLRLEHHRQLLIERAQRNGRHVRIFVRRV